MKKRRLRPARATTSLSRRVRRVKQRRKPAIRAPLHDGQRARQSRTHTRQQWRDIAATRIEHTVLRIRLQQRSVLKKRRLRPARATTSLVTTCPTRKAKKETTATRAPLYDGQRARQSRTHVRQQWRDIAATRIEHTVLRIRLQQRSVLKKRRLRPARATTSLVTTCPTRKAKKETTATRAPLYDGQRARQSRTHVRQQWRDIAATRTEHTVLRIRSQQRSGRKNDRKRRPPG